MEPLPHDAKAEWTADATLRPKDRSHNVVPQRHLATRTQWSVQLVKLVRLLQSLQMVGCKGTVCKPAACEEW